MTASDFPAFYAAVHRGRNPFPWQARLLKTLIEHGWPEAIAIPTGCGKTSIVDVAVFALALQADLPAAKRSPIRIFFVVDRRLVVDDVSRHAEQIAIAIRDAKEGPVGEVAARLRSFGGQEPLITATLRGGMYRSDTWADEPNQPVVCVSTVDQVGSRLLFRGYGLTDARRPIDAALVGADSLILLDEAHLSQPFLDTLEAVRRYQSEQWSERRVGSPIRVVHMSATTREASGAYALSEEDYHSSLAARLNASKVAVLEETATLERTAADRARALADRGTGVVGVVLNTVSSARLAFAALREAGEECVLLIGRIRPFDRDRLMERYLDRIRTDREHAVAERLFVVATQTVEVGADLDFDALVTEIAPLDSLRQRFGRLDRVGRKASAQAYILRPKKGKERDLVYGDATSNTWAWLSKHAIHGKDSRSIDFGVLAMQALWEAEGDVSLLSRSERGPILFPAYLDAWVQTNPAPTPDPDVALFLHGPDALRSADIQIVWRADLPPGSDLGWTEAWTETLALAPPLTTEALSLPIGAARKWLCGERANVADQEGIAVDAEEVDADRQVRQFLIWRGPDRSVAGDPRRLRPGDTVIVRSSEGGTDEYGWNPESGPVRDVGDLCANERARQGLGRFRVRIHPEVLYLAGEGQQKEALKKLIALAASDDVDAWEELAAVRDAQTGPQQWNRQPTAYPGGLVWHSKWPKRPNGRIRAEFDEQDEDDGSSLTRTLSLHSHTREVTALAKHYAAKCGLDADLGAAIEAATTLHDLGKADHRFQLMLALNRTPNDEPLAKSDPSSSPAEIKRRRDRSGYPEGARHEFTSVALAEQVPEVLSKPDPDLVLHLIGTHHGYGRPLPPLWSDDPDFEVRARVKGVWVETRMAAVLGMQRIDSEWVDRFWRLVRRYGWWGLAYLEAIVRRADCVRSRQDEEAQA